MNYPPDFIVVEGPKAGGHLGFKMDELLIDEKEDTLDKIVTDVIKLLESYKEFKRYSCYCGRRDLYRK